jgi:hypothetical protein
MALEGTYGASVVTSGGGDEEAVAEIINHFMIITGITPVGSVWATMGSLAGDEFPPDISEKAQILGRKLVHDWKHRVSTPEIEAHKARFMERMRQLTTYRKDEWPSEYECWRKHRGL